MNSDPKVIFITGCSTGIGKAAAELLAKRGHHVCATARRDESVEDLKQWARRFEGRATAIQLDVTRREQIAPAVEQVLSKHHKIDVLVNNAGYGQPGSIEDLDDDAWQNQFDVNVFGLLALTRAVLPHMRQRRQGRVVNVSSVVAHMVTPYMGAYNASKHAVEAINTAMRMELKPWNIKVVAVEPGPIKTEFRANVEKAAPSTPEDAGSAYTPFYRAYQSHWDKQFTKGGAPPEAVAEAIRKACEADRPRTRYRITAAAKFAPAILRLIGDRAADSVIWRTFGLGKIRPEQ